MSTTKRPRTNLADLLIDCDAREFSRRIVEMHAEGGERFDSAEDQRLYEIRERLRKDQVYRNAPETRGRILLDNGQWTFLIGEPLDASSRAKLETQSSELEAAGFSGIDHARQYRERFYRHRYVTDEVREVLGGDTRDDIQTLQRGGTTLEIEQACLAVQRARDAFRMHEAACVPNYEASVAEVQRIPAAFELLYRMLENAYDNAADAEKRLTAEGFIVSAEDRWRESSHNDGKGRTRSVGYMDLDSAVVAGEVRTASRPKSTLRDSIDKIAEHWKLSSNDRETREQLRRALTDYFPASALTEDAIRKCLDNYLATLTRAEIRDRL